MAARAVLRYANPRAGNPAESQRNCVRRRSWIDTGNGLLRREKRHLAQTDVNVRRKFGVKTSHDLIQMCWSG